MRIAIIGYGKMGQMVEKIALKKGHEIACVIGSQNTNELESIGSVDIAIEFTSPDSALANYKALAAKKIPTVTGTTGWMKNFNEVVSQFNTSSTPFFYASNFSIGIQITRKINSYLAKIMEKFPAYQAEIKEWHHLEKKDSPSGTALTLAQDLIDSNPNYLGIASNRKPGSGELPVQGFRKENIPGTHTISYTSSIDQISLSHEAFSRLGFATGAIEAAEFLNSKSSGIYTMNDLINIDQ